jgi:7,8-dihydropterin-6-yl-methyl-4-(beta-D-ribofuranosyl)aminobenzene 5'-phosphate synthase
MDDKEKPDRVDVARAAPPPPSVINRRAFVLTGVDQVHAVVGGFHLATPAFEPIIWPTVEALSELGPQVVAPAHCTGWRATHALAAAFPDAFIPGSVGTKYVFE